MSATSGAPEDHVAIAGAVAARVDRGQAGGAHQLDRLHGRGALDVEADAVAVLDCRDRLLLARQASAQMMVKPVATAGICGATSARPAAARVHTRSGHRRLRSTRP